MLLKSVTNWCTILKHLSDFDLSMEFSATYIITANRIQQKIRNKCIVDENTFWTPDVDMTSPKVCKKTPFPVKPAQQEIVPIGPTPKFKKVKGINIPIMRRLNFDLPEDEESRMISEVQTNVLIGDSTPRDTTLSSYIRYTLALPGTKAMCREGGCGSCIVMVRARRYPSGAVETFSVNSCLVLVLSCNEWEITTIEGVGNRLVGYDDVQKRIAAFNGTQCGFCTPGWVMQMNSLKDKHLTMAQLEKSFGSNTCRCTGFRPILDTMKSFASDATPQLRQKVRDIEDLCVKNKNNLLENICKKTGEICFEKKCFDVNDFDYLIEDYVKIDSTIAFNFGERKFFKVFEQNDVFDVWAKYGSGSYQLIDGNTAKGVYETYTPPLLLVDISSIRSLKYFEMDQNLILGSNVSMEDCIAIFRDIAKQHSEFSYLNEFVKHFEMIAHIPVRKIGSLAGNLMIKHANPAYQSDVFLLFESVGAFVTIKNSNGQSATMSLLDFLNYDMQEKLMVSIALPPLGSQAIYRSYKIMPRNQNSLAIVNAAFNFKINNGIVQQATIIFGNISSTFVHASKTEQYFVGKRLYDNNILKEALTVLCSEVVPMENPPEPSPECRKKLAIGLFYKFVLNTAPAGCAQAPYLSGGTLFDRPLSKGTQNYQTDPSLFPLNQPVQKLEAQIQSSGEAHYANDIPPSKNDVYAAFVLSTVHNGEVDCIDSSAVLAIKGILALFTASDIPGKNSFTYPGIQLQTENEEILATKIKFFGQPIAIIVAISEELGSTVAKSVKVTYKNVTESAPVLTIDAAKRDSKRYVAGDATIEPSGKGTDVKTVVKGVYEIEAQYHYYLEPLTTVVVPVDNRLEVHDSSQWIDLTQIAVGQCLNMKESDVLVKVRRVGGGFGGKISRNVQVATACALVARKLDTTCRMVLPMQTNMTIAGRRVPTQCDYEAGVDENGKIQYLNATLVQDVGCSNNENILGYVTGGFPNCYDQSRFSVKTGVVITDLPSNTFARAPGTAEGISSIEHIMEHIAFAVNKDPTSVRLANMRTEDNDLPSLIETLKIHSNYDERVKEIATFNDNNRWKKKAIKISVMSFPVEYYGNYSALVTIYRGDGTVTITTGGIEMGQGANTKAAQVCAYELQIPLDYVSVIPHYSFTAANNVFSGSSITSESVCYSVIKACKMLKERLKPVRDKLPDATWKELIKEAGSEENQIDLTAIYMMTDMEEDLSSYSAFAVVILEVELDVLTGRYQIDRVDIMEDVGLSANPNIDVGQVEGAYIQGIGYFTCEKLVYNAITGKLLTNRSLTYHVPLCQDIPVDFRVTLRYNSKNPKGVLGSKTCGEMGICTAHGITHALRQCIYESRIQSGYDVTQWVNIAIPYDTESILKALDVKYDVFLLTPC